MTTLLETRAAVSKNFGALRRRERHQLHAGEPARATR